MGIHPLSNGSKYGWSKLRSLFDFFFPFAKNGQESYIRCETATGVALEQGQTVPTITREFYTFRAFFRYYFDVLFFLPVREYKKNAIKLALKIGVNPEFAYQLGIIATDAFASGARESGGAASPLTWSHTVTGSNPLILVLGDTNGTDPITAMSYNSVTVNRLLRTANTDIGNEYSYGLAGPSTGTNTVSVSFSGDTRLYLGSNSYSGVSQSGLPDATKENQTVGGAGSVATTITTIADNCWVAGAGYTVGYTSVTNGTLRSSVGASSNTRVFDTNGVVTPAGNKTLTINGTTIYYNQLVSFAPFVAAATPGGTTLGLMGVG